jgi:hypothetical protein
VDDHQVSIISIANMKLNTTFLPKYAQEEAVDIMNDLRENLQECQTRLLSDHLLWQYKVCIYQHLDATDNQIWDLKNTLRYDSTETDDNDSKSSSLRAFLSLIIFNLIVISCFSVIIKSN